MLKDFTNNTKLINKREKRRRKNRWKQSLILGFTAYSSLCGGGVKVMVFLAQLTIKLTTSLSEQFYFRRVTQ